MSGTKAGGWRSCFRAKVEQCCPSLRYLGGSSCNSLASSARWTMGSKLRTCCVALSMISPRSQERIRRPGVLCHPSYTAPGDPMRYFCQRPFVPSAPIVWIANRPSCWPHSKWLEALRLNPKVRLEHPEWALSRCAGVKGGGPVRTRTRMVAGDWNYFSVATRRQTQYREID